MDVEIMCDGEAQVLLLVTIKRQTKHQNYLRGKTWNLMIITVFYVDKGLKKVSGICSLNVLLVSGAGG
jgi:hypothetical protein